MIEFWLDNDSGEDAKDAGSGWDIKSSAFLTAGQRRQGSPSQNLTWLRAKPSFFQIVRQVGHEFHHFFLPHHDPVQEVADSPLLPRHGFRKVQKPQVLELVLEFVGRHVECLRNVVTSYQTASHAILP